MAPIRMKTKTRGSISPGTSTSGGLRKRSSFSPSGFDAPKDKSKPPQLTPAKGISPPQSTYKPKGVDINKILADNAKRQQSSKGIQAFTPSQAMSSMNMSPAQSALGGSYSQALQFMKPSQLQNQFQKAQSFGRGVDIEKFKKDMDRYEAFQEAGGQPFQYEGQTYGNVQMPMLSANAPTTAQFFGDMAGGLSNLLGAAGEFVMGGGTLGNIIDATKQKFSQGKDFVQSAFNPGDINQRVANLTPEQRRAYMMYMNQGMPYQRAFELASGGQKFAMGGIANLN